MVLSRWQRCLVVSGIINILLLIVLGGVMTYRPTVQDNLIEVELATNTGPAGQTAAETVPIGPVAEELHRQAVVAERKPLSASPADEPDVAHESQAISTGAVSSTMADVAAAVGSPVARGALGDGESAAASAPGRSILPPRILRKIEPIYPEQARRQGLEGSVRVKIEVTPEGRASDVWVAVSSGYELLDNAAIQAVKQWRFVPAKDRKTGTPLACITTLTVTFRLSS